MRYIFTILIVVTVVSSSAAQEAKWQVGMHGGPLFNITEKWSGQGGFQLSPGVYFTKNERFVLGILPAYSNFTYTGYSEVPSSVNELYVLSERTYRYHTGSLSTQIRYTFNTRMLQPYGVAQWGVGVTKMIDEQVPAYGGITSETYASYSYGFGLGVQYTLSDAVRIDMNVQACGMDDFGSRIPEYFIRPMLGLLVQI